MSYPRKLHVLIIEDEQDPIDGYRVLLTAYRSEFPSVEPTIARCYADAEALLKGSHIFHCVILDLNLPLANKEQPPDGLAPGQQLLELAANRDPYPIPVLLVVSGKLNLAKLSDLNERLQKAVWYGQMVNKGPDMPEELKKGLRKAQEYCDVGIHIHDGGRSWYPTVSPREEDLLRRCVLSQQSCLGVDLQWWGAELGPSLSRPSTDAGPTKVLMGHFLLDDGLERSRASFFKFEPAGNAPIVCRDAGIFDQKLRHVNVMCTSTSHSRSLLVTQSVTDSLPVPLDRFLAGEPTAVQPHLGQLVADVAGQLQQLGRCSDDQVPVKDVLWKYHDRDNLEKAWRQTDIRAVVKSGGEGPLPLFDRLQQNGELLWVTKRSCTHGDLNATNIAVDTATPDRPRAYIFDAEGIHADVVTRDFAVLEVTTLLFLAGPEIQHHFLMFEAFYRDGLSPTGLPECIRSLPPIVQNTIDLLATMRKCIEQMPHAEVYPLVVFDTVMIQLGGVTQPPSQNKIALPVHACYLANWVTEWVKKCLPEVAGTPGS